MHSINTSVCLTSTRFSDSQRTEQYENIKGYESLVVSLSIRHSREGGNPT